jgi:hypothetical protein
LAGLLERATVHDSDGLSVLPIMPAGDAIEAVVGHAAIVIAAMLR